jgi:predicted metalloprotease
MHSALVRRVRRIALTVLVAAGATSLDSSPARAVTIAQATAPEVDVEASNAKIAQAYRALVGLWTDRFAELGVTFSPPKLLAYRGPVRTGCGVMSPDNAAYCPPRNAIYFDELFLARLAGAAARELDSDGDMAAIGVIAHEMGHAVVNQLGADSRIPYENEAAADCLAGAFTAHSGLDGSLEAGDLEEAFFGLALAGDPPLRMTGDQRTDRRLLLRASLMGHGTREQRLANFTAGYEQGAGACVRALRA